MKKEDHHGQIVARQSQAAQRQPRYPWVEQKHREQLQGTGFEGCAACSACSGKIEKVENQQVLRCSTQKPYGVYVTAEKARLCRRQSPSYLKECPPTVKRYEKLCS